MMSFDEIWPRFSWVIEEMRGGMCFFEGFITSIDERDLVAPISKVMARASNCGGLSATWSDDTDKADWEREYDVATSAEFLRSGKITMLDLKYEFEASNTNLAHRLMFEKWDARTVLEILCDRDAILSSPGPKQSIADAISEFRALKRSFRGDALFLGPDTVIVPLSLTDYPDFWLKIE